MRAEKQPWDRTKLRRTSGKTPRKEEFIRSADGSETVTDDKEATIRNLLDRIERLRRDCAELYQVIGTMADHCPNPSDPAIVKALDNASDAANGQPRRHEDLLPFILPKP